MTDYLIVFAAAFAAVVLTTPLARWVSVKVGAVDRPGGRRVHTRPTPRLGGLALFVGFLAAVAVARRLETFEEVFSTTSDPEAIVLAAGVIMALGLIDDVRGVAAPVKLAGQVLAAGTLVLFGVVLRYVYIPGSPGSVVALSADLGALLTILAIVVMINAINLVDGLDGLAAGLAGIAAVALFSYVQFADLTAVGPASSPELIFAAVAGLAAGFLVFNFHPASVFMGDSGAMLLGLLVGAASVLAIGSTIAPGGRDFAAISVPVLVPALVLAVPLVDTIWTILRRLRSGRAVFSPDKKHLHHRLIEIGQSHRRAVLTMYYWSALVAFAAVGVAFLPVRVVLGVAAAGVLVAVVAMVLGQLLRRRRGHRPERRDQPVVVLDDAPHGHEEMASDQRKRGNPQL